MARTYTSYEIRRTGWTLFLVGGVISLAMAIIRPPQHGGGPGSFHFASEFNGLDGMFVALCVASMAIGLFNVFLPRHVGMLVAGIDMLAT